ncbi:MAG TPA: winged helix DNA-binding domain-containing protein [Ilumatobacteraceae bacterium]|nr:winged helix DNA-binding domain-containing protein [Ilumatobacteraceae bacterium]
MALTPRQLNRATLARQLLLGRQPLNVVDGVRRIVALQAQEAASPYLALWNRIADFDPAELDGAFARHEIVKATLIRVTLHAVAIEDHPAFKEAMQGTLRSARLDDRRFRRTGLSSADADALLPEVLAYASQPRTNAELEAWLDQRLGELPKPSVWWALRQYGPFAHAVTGPPWSFGPRPAYVAAPGPPAPGDPAGSLQHLARRYLEGFGPASAEDLAQFALIRRPVAREALAGLGSSIERIEGPDGRALFDVPGGPRPDEGAPAPPRLMAMWDSVLLAYADRSRVIAPEHRQHVMRRNGDVLPTVLVDGYVCGVWRPVDDGIEVTAFRTLSGDTWDELAAEARSLVAFLAEREPGIYRRYAHWWTTLPSAEVTVLPA